MRNIINNFLFGNSALASYIINRSTVPITVGGKTTTALNTSVAPLYASAAIAIVAGALLSGKKSKNASLDDSRAYKTSLIVGSSI